MVALYKKKKEKKKGLTVLNVHYDAKNSHTCDYMIRYASELDTVFLSCTIHVIIDSYFKQYFKNQYLFSL